MRTATIRRLAYVAVGVVAVGVRWAFVDFQSGDFVAFLSRWWSYIDQHGHLAALQDGSFSNYNTPYLVLLALATYLPVRAIAAIKAISIAFDVLLAVTASRLVAAVRPRAGWLPFVTFAVVSLLPTVVMNSGVWAQCDSIYATFCLASLVSLVRGRPWAASAWFGVAFAFKLQAVFLLPVLVGVLLTNRLRLRTLVAAPVTFLACLVPALIAGRSLLSQLAVYPAQISDPSGVGGTVGGAASGGGAPGGAMPGGPGTPGVPGGRGGPAGGVPAAAPAAQTATLTHNAPTPYAWLPSSTIWLYVGLAVTALVVVAFGVWLLLRKTPLSGGEIVLVAATSTLLIPLLLPQMHERYFYLAEVLLVVACMVDWRFLVPALGIQIASISTYFGYLRNQSLMPLGAAAGFAVAAGLAAAWLLVRTLRASPRAEPVS
jgi:Gpi18-like mannosyltransferase